MQDIEGGQPLPITPEKRFAYMPPGLAVSPDGSSVIFTSGYEEKFFAYPINGGEPRAIAGPKQGDWPILWSADGRSLLVTRLDVSPTEVYLVDIRTGERRLWKTFVPPDPAGVENSFGEWVVPTPDGRSYSYSYMRNLSELYLVDGVK